MEKLWLFTDEHYQLIDLHPFHNEDVTIGSRLKDTFTIPFQLDVELVLKWSYSQKRWTLIHGDDQTALVDNERLLFHDEKNKPLTFVFQEGQADWVPISFYIGNKLQVTGSSSDLATFSFPRYEDDQGFLLDKEREKWCLLPYSETMPVYVNGERIYGAFPLEIGDVFSWGLNEWTLKTADVVELLTDETYQTELPLIRRPRTMLADKYPNYQRMPRLVYERPRTRVKFSWPTDSEKDNRHNLWVMVLPPLVMMIVMVVVAIVQPRGIYVIISVFMFVTTLVTSTYQYIRESKQLKTRRKERKTNYTNYLREKREVLHQLYEKQKFVLHYQFPGTATLKELTRQLSPRIWERSRADADFLEIRLGTATLPADYEIQGSEQELANRSFDELYKEAKIIVDHYRQVPGIPLTIRLLDGPLGVVGKHSIIRTAVQQMIMQLAFFHSYHDLRFVILFDEEDYGEWEWLKWLPHLKSLHTHGRNLIYNEQTRDQLLSGIYDLLKEREHTENRDKKLFLPHLVFIVASDKLIHEHGIVEYLNRNCAGIGAGAIFLAKTKDNLTENISSVVRYINEQEGDILILNKVANGRTFRLDPFTREGNEAFARRLASLNHHTGFINSIPENVTFLEMMGAEDVEELHIRDRWAAGDPIKSLAVPIGLRSKTDRLELNLHEKAHGPHGLLAGTTGSGKSELLQAYILSLVVNFHPHDVAFLLIDFKGGGMAQLFNKLPHLLATMTNINDEDNFSERALAAIKSESIRRQKLFSKYNINHIDDYQLLYRQGKVATPLPHLFIISDEFAELKREEPDFIRELVSAARIGRSLGMHLILATQKPAGVVDDQIRSNSRFRICLRVQDSADSNDILGNGDAAELKQVGRGYLQVGNNEIYELFQSAWSGAPYQKNIYTSEDDVFYVKDTGVYPISDVHAKADVQEKKETELDAIIRNIADIYQQMGLKRLKSPWLPPLPARLVRPEETKEETAADVFAFGLADHPEKQLQKPVLLPVQHAKNMAIYGAAGFGKTTAITAILLAAARRYSPDQMQFYLFDFGSGGLLPFRKLHHTGDYFLLDEKKKIEKFAKWLREDMQRRKDLFRKKGVPDIRLYNAQSEQRLPYFKIVVDNFETVREDMQELEEDFIQWAREGNSLGIQFILSVSRANGIRPNLLSSCPIRLSHYMVDQSEFYTIFSGSGKRTVEAIAGRALLKTAELETVQIFLPFKADSVTEQIEKLREEIERCNTMYPEAEHIYHVPMLPETLEMASFLKYKGLTAGQLFVGLEEETVRPLGINRRQMNNLIIIADPKRGKTNAVRLFLQQLNRMDDARIAISDSEELAFAKAAADQDWMYLDSKTDIEQYVDQLENDLQAREEEIREHMQTSLRSRPEIIAQYPVHYLVIDGLDTFIRKLDSRLQTRLINLMKRYHSIGFSVVASGNVPEWKGYDPLIVELKNTKDALLLVRKTDQTIFTLSYTSKEPKLNIGFGYLLNQGRENRVMIPLTDAKAFDAVQI